MEKNKCDICFRTFANRKALGSHMRSHVTIRPKENVEAPIQLGDASESAASSSSPSSEEESEHENGLYYGLRENPKRSIKLVDPEFDFAAINDGGGGGRSVSVVLQDRESETESTKHNPTPRRSKRKTRKSTTPSLLDHPYFVKLNSDKSATTESWTELEPASSISDTTTEEDVAYCLMMLSRDRKWRKSDPVYNEVDPDDDDDVDKSVEEENDDVDESDDEDESNNIKPIQSKGKYKCETCNRVFRSYQALGGHRANHKKMKLANSIATTQKQLETNHHTKNVGSVYFPEKKTHECPVCFRVFSSGQALGGHKRTHALGHGITTAQRPPPPAPAAANRISPLINNWIDLNLPAPVDDLSSQIEV